MIALKPKWVRSISECECIINTDWYCGCICSKKVPRPKLNVKKRNGGTLDFLGIVTSFRFSIKKGHPSKMYNSPGTVAGQQINGD